MAYCTLDEAWGSNFYEDSVNKNNSELSNSDNINKSYKSRSYNNLLNTNGPKSRYVTEDINFNIKPNLIENNQSENNPSENETIQGDIGSDDINIYNVKHIKDKEENENKINKKLLIRMKEEQYNINKLVNTYKKYVKKFKKMINILNDKLINCRRNTKLYLILLIISLVFNFILLIILIILIIMKK